MLIHSKELLMGGGGEKKEIMYLKCFDDGEGFSYYPFPSFQNSGVAISSSVGYPPPVLKSITGVLGSAGSKISFYYNNGYGQTGTVSGNFSKSITVAGYIFHSYSFVMWGITYFVLVSPKQKIDDFLIWCESDTSPAHAYTKKAENKITVAYYDYYSDYMEMYHFYYTYRY